MVSINSWEYPTNFLVLQPKTKFNGYPLILERPWFATIDAYISCRAGNMTIKNGPLSKQLVLYLHAQPCRVPKLFCFVTLLHTYFPSFIITINLIKETTI